MAKIDSEPLLPQGQHSVDMAMLQRLAVDGFAGSAIRRSLFGALKILVDELVASGTLCELWIDGSFLTEKADPADIDLTIVIDQVDFSSSPLATQHLLSSLCAKKHSLSLALDCYLADSADQRSRAYWDGFWGSGRDSRPKGYAVLSLGGQND